MPLDLAQLQRGTARVTVSYAGETFWIDYRTHAYTVAVHRELQAALGGDDEAAKVEAIVDLLARLLDRWEVTEEGIPLPVTVETLARFPVAMLTAIVAAVAEHVADPNRAPTTADPTPTSSGSSPPDRLVLVPTGTDS